jgi:hypothetical protein
MTEWVSLQGDMANLELYVLIDEKVTSDSAARIEEIRLFIAFQAPSTAVGIAYRHNGDVHVIQTPTTDHLGAAKALKQPRGI